MTSAVKLSSKDWFGKASAALILGFFIALGVDGILLQTILGGVPMFSEEHQIAMWIVSPIYSIILSFCFFFRSGLRAWSWLALANAIIWGTIFLTS